MSEWDLAFVKALDVNNGCMYQHQKFTKCPVGQKAEPWRCLATSDQSGLYGSQTSQMAMLRKPHNFALASSSTRCSDGPELIQVEFNDAVPHQSWHQLQKLQAFCHSHHQTTRKLCGHRRQSRNESHILDSPHGAMARWRRCVFEGPPDVPEKFVQQDIGVIQLEQLRLGNDGFQVVCVVQPSISIAETVSHRQQHDSR
ncbi:hypothetical protein B0H12DRAFT_1081555 [Mycena haematopus]|nr:hypothetical protein B0H12DRAFT_1081555 [Mycena haematopus]